MDLSRFETREKAEAGIDITLEIDGEVCHGTDDQPIVFCMKGSADPEVGKLIMQQRRSTNRTPAEAVADDVALAKAACVGWSDNFTVGGEPLPFSKKNVEQVFSMPRIRGAVLPNILNDRLFMNGP